MPVDNSVALGIKGPNVKDQVDAVTDFKKTMKAVGDATSIMGKGVNNTGNSFAFNPPASDKDE